MDDEVQDHRHGTLRCIGEHPVPTPREPLETNQMRRERQAERVIACPEKGRCD